MPKDRSHIHDKFKKMMISGRDFEHLAQYLSNLPYYSVCDIDQMSFRAKSIEKGGKSISVSQEITWGQDKLEFQEVNSVLEKSLELPPSFWITMFQITVFQIYLEMWCWGYWYLFSGCGLSEWKTE